MHRMFIQQNGLEMLGKIEKEENDKEKNKNFIEFQKNQEVIHQKNEELEKKMLGFIKKLKKS